MTTNIWSMHRPTPLFSPLLFVSASASATEYHVGSAGIPVGVQAYEELTGVPWDDLKPGYMVIVHGGDYDSALTIASHGTAEHPIIMALRAIQWVNFRDEKQEVLVLQ